VRQKQTTKNVDEYANGRDTACSTNKVTVCLTNEVQYVPGTGYRMLDEKRYVYTSMVVGIEHKATA